MKVVIGGNAKGMERTNESMDVASHAPGWPGIPGRWTSSAKSGVGTALSAASPLWFTLSHGIVNEVYSPRIDSACTRDLGLIVTAEGGYFSEEKRHTDQTTRWSAPGVPAFRLENTCTDGCYRVEKDVLSDPRRPVLLQRVRFRALRGLARDYRLHALLAPHLGNCGAGNTAWVGEYKGTPMLFASHGENALALAASVEWRARSAGFVGSSDGWQDLVRHGRLAWRYERAENGNVALVGELAFSEDEPFSIALAFGRTWQEAALHASSSLAVEFDGIAQAYGEAWSRWQSGLSAPVSPRKLFATSASVLRCHQPELLIGATIASLSIPWGFHKGDEDLGGYHLVWSRDMVEAAGAFAALGDRCAVADALGYLRATQESDGHWPQNMWLDGSPYWQGVQMDETALPILLVDLARRERLIDDDIASFWPMVRRAAAFVARNGPVTEQDRWEEDAGYTPFTLAAEVAGLLAAAEMAERAGEPTAANYLRDTADWWNSCIERWIYAEGGPLCGRVGVAGYYVRVAPVDASEAASPLKGYVPVKNRAPGDSSVPAVSLVSPDALALVRFGLRAADDPRILATVKVIDDQLRVDTPGGPAWHRYEGDGYGEHDDGAPFDGVGVGRGWPLLTGERAHYELARGDRDGAEALLRTMESFASPGGLLPEQVWDAPDIPERELFRGRPSGSAMPLVWAHAEYVKLVRSLVAGSVFDTPPQTLERYARRGVRSTIVGWRFNHKIRSIPAGSTLRIESCAPCSIHWSTDGWKTVHDDEVRDSTLGVWWFDVPTSSLAPSSIVMFTFRWDGGRWEGTDFTVRID